MEYFLCIDLGSSGAKSSLLTKDGKVVGMVINEYRFLNPQPSWSEIDPNVVWQKICDGIKGVCRKTGINSETIVGISISTIGETIMFLDVNGDPVCSAIESMDGRENGYRKTVEYFENTIGSEEIYSITSYPLSSLASAIKIIWMKQNQPDIFSKVDHITTFQDFIIYRLTQKFAIDYSMASRTMLYDVLKKEWSNSILDKIGLDKKLLSPSFPAHTVVGGVTEKAALETGLRINTPVILGAHDQACASLGVGIVDEGIAMDGTGSVEAIVVPTRTPIKDISMLSVGHGSQCHVTADIYLGIGFQLTVGLLVRWFKEQIAKMEQQEAEKSGADVYDLITSNAAKSTPGANGIILLPHFRGAGTGRKPPLNPLSRGSLLGLSLETTHNDISRAIFEGITLETKLILSSMEKSGISIEELRVTGGGAKSNFWLQLKADITGKKIVVPTITEATSLGTALLIGTGLGIFSSLKEATEKIVTLSSEFIPNPKNQKVYERQFSIYKKIYSKVEEINNDLNQFIEETKE